MTRAERIQDIVIAMRDVFRYEPTEQLRRAAAVALDTADATRSDQDAAKPAPASENSGGIRRHTQWQTN
jgi:hypothetical protein